MRVKPRLFFSLTVLLTLVLGFGGGVIVDRVALVAYAAPSPASSNPGLDWNLIEQAWSTIQQHYVDRAALQPTPLTYGAINGMVDALGDTGHSTFLSPLMVKEEQSFTRGQYTGVGLQVQEKNGQVVVAAPFDNSPAQRAGVRSGDTILKVNGNDVTGLPLEQVISQILGPAGTSVTLTIENPHTGVTRNVTLVRARITLESVTWQRLPGTTIADVRIVSFSQGATQALVQALTQINQQKMTGLVLDLRNNPGGLLDEAVGTASQFLSSGNVLLVKDAQGKVTPIPVKPGGIATHIPMVVLVNGGTASAAEIVAVALQDAHRATLVGETTFGTGTVLNEFGLSDGSALMLATQEWLTPKGRVIWHKGITPDEVVPLPANVTPLTPQAVQGMTPVQLQSSGDAQLLRALQLLQSSR
jgi:carboxyl-terminal processing protease